MIVDAISYLLVEIGGSSVLLMYFLNEGEKRIWSGNSTSTSPPSRD